MIKEITVNVSKKIGQANFSSAMLSASITMTVASDTEVAAAYKEGWALCWEEIERQEQALRQDTILKDAIDNSVEASQSFLEDVNQETTDVCPIHKIPFVLRPAGVSKTTGKGYPAFLACPGKMPDGSFCKEKPAK